MPRFALTAAAFGIDGAPPRAVPQDGFLAAASQWIDGGLLVAAITALALLATGIGYGRLAQRVLPAAGTAGAAAAAIIAIWNPFVAERLLQGHWSLLTGYAALGWIICAVLDLRDNPQRRRWFALTSWFAVAGLTPTGSLLALIAALTALGARWFRPADDVRSPQAQTSRKTPLLTPRGAEKALAPALLPLWLLALWLLTALPWLVATAFSESATAGVRGAQAFAARAEPGLGTFGAVLGLSGIWNAEAVPASRGFWWAAVATVCFLVVVIGGTVVLIRSTAPRPHIVTALGALASAVIVLVTLSATGPGLAVLDWVLAQVPGTGLFRDTQKYLALAMPFAALATAAVAGWLRAWVPTGFAVAGIALLLVAPLPDLAWGVGGKLRPIQYPPDYAAVIALVDPGDRTVAVWPATPMRHFPWNNSPSLSPLPRMLDATVLMSGQLTVDDDLLDAPAVQTRAVVAVLENGGDPQQLADLGIDMVITENSPAPPLLAAGSEHLYAGADLSVYQIAGAVSTRSQPTRLAWAAAGTAHGLWLLCLLAGPLAQLCARRTRANSSAVAGHE